MISALRPGVERLRAFFMSDVYPIVVCALAAVGSISGLEFYFCMLHVVMIFTALSISHSVRPMLPSLLTAVMQLSVKHSPFYPNYSDYYYTGWRLPVFFIMCAACACAIVIFVIRNRTLPLEFSNQRLNWIIHHKRISLLLQSRSILPFPYCFPFQPIWKWN